MLWMSKSSWAAAADLWSGPSHRDLTPAAPVVIAFHLARHTFGSKLQKNNSNIANTVRACMRTRV